MGAVLLLLLVALLLVFAAQAWKTKEKERQQAEWESYLTRQHQYIDRLLRNGEVPTYVECPHFFAQGVSDQLIELASRLNAVATVKTAKARNNNFEAATRLLHALAQESAAELTEQSRNVIAREVAEAASHNLIAGLRDEVGKHLAAAGRAKRPETKQKYINAAVAAIDAVPPCGLSAHGLEVISALRESIAQL